MNSIFHNLNNLYHHLKVLKKAPDPHEADHVENPPGMVLKVVGRHPANYLIGMWVLLALFVGSANAQAPEIKILESVSLASFTVDSTTDAVDASPGDGVCATALNVCSLRAAIQEANALAGDDMIHLPAGTYTLALAGAGEDAAATGDLDLTSNIMLNGAGAATTIIDGNWADRVLHVTGAFTVNLAGLTVTHGNGSGGGIRNDGGALTITDSAISDNNSGSSAGGIFNSGMLTITNSTIFDNNAGTEAGGILSSGALTILDSVFAYNNAGGDAGGILSSGSLIITGGTFDSNNSGAGGGGIFNTYDTEIDGSVFTDNNSMTGGAIYGAGALIVTSSAFHSNNAYSGGAIFDGGFPITITHSTFSENSALSGGGVYTLLDVIIANSTFSGNDASTGDDLYTAGGTLLVTSSTIFGYIPDPDHASGVGNALASGGGGVYNAPGGVVTFFNTIVAGHDYGGNCVGAITNGGNNLDDGTTCGWGSANGSMSSVNPQLGALTGSPAYFPLAASSPAIDAGNNAICAAAPVNNGSQNGVARPTDGDGNGTATCDIGAVEREAGFRAYLPYAVR